MIARERLREAIESEVEAHRVTVVSAPSGFGKTVAVSAWARHAPGTVAWLSLTRYDADPLRLLDGVIAALHRLAARSDDPTLLGLLGVDVQSRDVAASHRALCEALEEVDGRIVLVVDDVHRAGGRIDEGILGALVEQAPTALRLVLVGRERPNLPLQRLALAGEVGVVDADALRFTPAEVVDAAAVYDWALTPADARVLVDRSDGWAAALRLVLVSTAPARTTTARRLAFSSSTELLTEFVETEILGALPADLAAFVLDATTTSDLDAALAEALTGRQDAVVLLEECADRGLFLDRFDADESRTGYRWHTVFSAHCRRVLRRRDPERAARLHRAAARHLADADPLGAIEEAIAGADPGLAVEVLRDSWVWLLVGPNGGALDRVCGALPEPWRSDVEVMLIRAAAIGMAGSRAEGRALLDRAMGELEQTSGARAEEARRTKALATLLLADRREDLVTTVGEVSRDLATWTATSSRRYLASMLVLGGTQVAVRSRQGVAVRTLEETTHRSRMLGEHVIARRAAGLLAFAQAFDGDFGAATETLGTLRGTTTELDAWNSFLGGAENFAAGWIAYWTGDLVEARVQLHRVIGSGTGAISFTGVARVVLALIAAVAGDARERAEAHELLRGVPDTEIRGVPWPAYRMSAVARLAAAEGRHERAAEIVRRFRQISTIPALGVHLAELARREVGNAAALHLLGQLRESGTAPYVRANALTTLALVHRSQGEYGKAHAVLERALDLAAPRGIALPFLDATPELGDLLAEHGAWGTSHTAFLVRLATRPEEHQNLSERGREVLGYLRTTLTAAEIADELGVSINTVKTHLKGIYRKLGVASRREAVRKLA